MWIPMTAKMVELAGMEGCGMIIFSNFIIHVVDFKNLCTYWEKEEKKS
jgi:hypothetical protein